MSIKKVLNQLDEFFDLSKKKQRKKHDKLLEIIASLEEKKEQFRNDVKSEADKDNNTKQIYNMCKEFKVLSKLLKKAKKQEKKISSEINK